MDNPERHLAEWIEEAFITGEEAHEAARECIEFMRKRGWQFEPVPVDARE
jgi:hypothetical protein